MTPSMKNNLLKTLSLVALLIVLLIVGRWASQSHEDRGAKLFVFDQSELISITLNKARIALKNGGPVLPKINHPASPDKFNSLIEKLRGLRIVKEIEGENRDEYFAHQDLLVDIETSDGKLKSRIGDVSDITGNFYAEGENALGQKRIFVLQDTSFYEGFYKDELELKLRKYWELKKLLNSDAMELADKRLFRPASLDKARKVRFDPRFNRWFEVDLEENLIDPAPPEGINNRVDNQQIKELLLSVSFSHFQDQSDSVLEDLLSSIELIGKDFKQRAELFGRLNGKNGLFAKFAKNNRIYTLNEKGRDAFFISSQLFYDKRPQLKINKELKGLKFALGRGAGDLNSFVLEDGETFKVRSSKGGLSDSAQQRFNLIFNALFAANGLEQASRVRGLEAEEIETVLSKLKDPVYLEFLGKTFVFALKEPELFLYDLEQRLEFVYKTGEAIKSFSAEQFFALEQ